MRVESALHGRVRDNCKATPSPGLDRPSPLMLWTRQSFGRSRRLSCHDRRPAEVELRVSSTDSSRFPHALYLLDPREVCFWSRLFQLWQSHWPKGRPELQQSTRIKHFSALRRTSATTACLWSKSIGHDLSWNGISIYVSIYFIFFCTNEECPFDGDRTVLSLANFPDRHGPRCPKMPTAPPETQHVEPSTHWIDRIRLCPMMEKNCAPSIEIG